MADRDAIIDVRTVVILAVAAAALFTLALYLMVSQRNPDLSDSPGNHSFSSSAIGRKAFVDLLRGLDQPVVVYKYTERRAPVSGSLVLIAEPLEPRYIAAAKRRFARAGAILFVLPKRRSVKTAKDGRFSAEIRLHPAARVQRVLRAIAPGASLIRDSSGQSWSRTGLGPAPTLSNAQLMRGGTMTPLVASRSGVLLAEISAGRPRIWVLSDPDILANHGIDNGDNAIFAVRVIQTLLPAGRTLVIDETLHAFIKPPSFWAAFFRLPYLVVTVGLILLCLVLGLVGLSRFGKAVSSPPALKAGKDLLIENIADLMTRRGADATVLRTYARVAIDDVAARLHAPRARGEEAVIEWLQRLEPRQKVTRPIAELMERIGTFNAKRDSGDAVALAQGLSRWRREMLGDA
jgi:hypothetical protein